MKNLTLFSIIGLITTGVFFGSCKKHDVAMQTKPTLYDSLGGTKLVTDPRKAGTSIESGRLLVRSIIDSTIFVIAADPSINGHFTALLVK